MSFKPFYDFIDLKNKGYSEQDTINMVKSFHNLGRNQKNLLRIFRNWGRYANLLNTGENGNKIFELKENIDFKGDFCFVIMSFSNKTFLEEIYNYAIKPIINSLGYQCERINEQDFNGRITSHVLNNIMNARFILADLTDARPNCYYELGIAHTLKKDVIHITNSVEDIHFDIKDFNFIIYNDYIDLRRKLKKRIIGTINS